MNTFEILRQERISHGLSLRRVARDAEIVPPYLSDLEKGKRKLSFDLLKRLCRIIGITAKLPGLTFQLAKENHQIPMVAIIKLLENERLFMELTKTE